MRDKVNKAKNIIKNNIYLTLGTVNKDEGGWVTPLFYAYDEKYDFYWISPKDSVHVKNNERNKNSTIVIFDSHAPKWTGVAVWVKVVVEELNNPQDIKKGLKYIFSRLKEPVWLSEKVTGKATYRVYKAVPNKFWITDDVEINGETVDSRREIDIKQFTK